MSEYPWPCPMCGTPMEPDREGDDYELVPTQNAELTRLRAREAVLVEALTTLQNRLYDEAGRDLEEIRRDEALSGLSAGNWKPLFNDLHDIIRKALATISEE